MPFLPAGLSGMDVEFGDRLWKRLRESAEFPIAGMLWLMDSEWRLVIASPLVDQLGPRDAYRKLAELLQLDERPRFLDVQLIGLKNPLYKALHSVFGNAASVEGARLGGSQVGGIFIEDAYLYGV